MRKNYTEEQFENVTGALTHLNMMGSDHGLLSIYRHVPGDECQGTWVEAQDIQEYFESNHGKGTKVTALDDGEVLKLLACVVQVDINLNGARAQLVTNGSHIVPFTAMEGSDFIAISDGIGARKTTLNKGSNFSFYSNPMSINFMEYVSSEVETFLFVADTLNISELRRNEL